MWVTLLLGGATGALAKPPGWLYDGAEVVRFEGAHASLPTVRGAATDYVHAVEAQVRGPGQAEARPVLAKIDLAGQWSRMSTEMAHALGIVPEPTWVGGERRQVVELAVVELGGLALEGVRMEVRDEGPDFALGFVALPELAAALLPNDRILRIVPAARGDLVIGAVGAAVPAHAESLHPLRVAAGPTDAPGAAGFVTLQTAEWGRHGLGSPRPAVQLALDADVASVPAADLGVLPYQMLAAQALAVDPAGRRVAVGDRASLPDTGLDRRPTSIWDADPAVLALTAARARFARLDPASVAAPELPADDGTGLVPPPAGDAGDPRLRDVHRNLASALWRAGSADEALDHYRQAAAAAGDRCEDHLRLAERVLAAGARPVPRALVIAALRRAAGLHEAWRALPDDGRDRLLAGKRVGRSALVAPQAAGCARAHGLLLATYTVLGDVAARDEHAALYLTLRPESAYARAVARLGVPSPELARLTAEALGAAAIPEEHRTLVGLVERAWAGDPERARALAAELARLPLEAPLATALGAWRGISRADEPVELIEALTAERPDQPALQLVRALVHGTPVPEVPASYDERYPGSVSVRALRAVHHALEGDPLFASALLLGQPVPTSPDWWAARGVLAAVQSDAVGVEEVLVELRLRFPLLPLGYLGLPGSLPRASASR